MRIVVLVARGSVGTFDSYSSIASVISAAGPKCFIAGTSFRCPDDTFIGVEAVEPHEVLCGHNGVSVEVVTAVRHEIQERELTFLRTSDSSLVVTSDHPIMVPRGQGQQSLPAGHLQANDIILSANGEQKLVEVEYRKETIEVYQLSFYPDIPIEAFYGMADPPILAKGCKIRKTRRGGMKKKLHRDAASVPETYDSWK